MDALQIEGTVTKMAAYVALPLSMRDFLYKVRKSSVKIISNFNGQPFSILNQLSEKYLQIFSPKLRASFSRLARENSKILDAFQRFKDKLGLLPQNILRQALNLAEKPSWSSKRTPENEYSGPQLSI